MRVVRETMKEDIRVSIFSWNNKYLIKFEQGLIEQTFKVPLDEILGEEELEGFLTGSFWEQTKKRFEEMRKSLQIQLENV